MTCAYDQIQLTFVKELFGVDETMGENLFDTDCQPVWSDNQWNWDVGLGACGMTMSTGSYLTAETEQHEE